LHPGQNANERPVSTNRRVGRKKKSPDRSPFKTVAGDSRNAKKERSARALRSE
jgi:hypothetical protein